MTTDPPQIKLTQKRPTIGVFRLKAPNHMELVDLKEISDEEVVVFRKHVSVIRSRYENETLAFLIADNLDRFGKDLDGIMKALQARPREHDSIADDALQCINLHICNLLSSARTYVDHQETRIKRKYGDPSKELAKFTEARSKEYDTEFCYRFMYHMRNYIQHCGLPASQTGLTHKMIKREPREIEFSMNPHALKSRLLQEYDWKKIIRDDLAGMPEEIPLIPIVEKYVECIKRIHSSTVGFDIDEVRTSARYLTELGNLYPESPRAVSLFVFGKTNPPTFTQQKIPLFQIEIIKMSTERYGIHLLP